MKIDVTEFQPQERYKILTGLIAPRPIAFVTSLSEEGRVNGAPFSYFSIVSIDPPLISLSIQRNQGQMKDTARNILREKAFVVQGVDGPLLEKANAASAPYGPEESEIDALNLKTVQSKKISVPGILGAPYNMECVLERHIEIQSMEHTTVDLILGRVVYMDVEEGILSEDLKVRQENYDPIARLGGPNYATLKKSFALERPKSV